MKIISAFNCVRSACTVVALVLFLSGCQALQRLDQGLYQATESFTETDLVTGQRSLSTAARAQQIQQGNAYIDKLLKDEKTAGRAVSSQIDAKQYQRLVRVFDRLHRVSHLSKERWQPILIQRDSFNAFTTGGTYIVVHTELMRQLKSDDELAAVVGHEIAHTVANHIGEAQTHRTLSALTGSKSARSSSYQAAFTHENEREADRVGILYAALAGYDPYAASRIWQRQYQQRGNARALFAHDHPVNAERAVETQTLAKKVTPYYQKGQINPNYPSLLTSNVLWQKRQPSAAVGEGGGVLSVLSTVAGAYVQHQGAKQEAARQQAHARFVKAVEGRMQLVSSQAVGTGKLKTVWRFNANGSALKQLTMGLMVKKAKRTLMAVAHVKTVVRPYQSFTAVFDLPENLTVQQLKALPARFYVDDALPLQ